MAAVKIAGSNGLTASTWVYSSLELAIVFRYRSVKVAVIFQMMRFSSSYVPFLNSFEIDATPVKMLESCVFDLRCSIHSCSYVTA